MRIPEQGNLQPPPGFEADLEVLRAFERGLGPAHFEQSEIPAPIFGYGEISTVFEIQALGLQGLACKRLPIFGAPQELERYTWVYQECNPLLATDTELFLRAAPSFLVWVLWLLFLKDVVDRYYSFRLVTIDFIGC